MLKYQETQQQFAAHIRNPEKNPAVANIESRRLKIYNDLFYNNIEGFISGAFPIFKTLFDESSWHIMIRHFVESHQSSTPYFLEISQEYLKYLDNDDLALHKQYPFAKELCHYEWVELALDVANEHQEASYDANGDLFISSPLLSAVAWPLIYQWPVHKIGKDYQPSEPEGQPSCIVVYRNRNDNVEFLEANPVTLRLLEIIQSEQQPTGEIALKQIAAEMQQDNVQSIIDFGLPILEQLRSQGIILGTRL